MFESIISATVKANSKKYLNLNSSKDLDSRFRGNDVFFPHDRSKRYLLYVHIPFCEKLCSYCSFNRYEFEAKLAVDYFSALREEIKIYHDYGCNFDGVYIGGGTPTILPDELFKTISLLRQLYSIKELSVETNPGHLTKENLCALKELRVDRLSVGAQSFNDDILKKIGRFDTYGSGDELKSKIKGALDNSYVLNVDMIFNFPFQTAKMLEDDIDCLKQVSPDQITFYPLMPSSTVSDKLGGFNHRNEKQFYYRILDRLSNGWEPLSVWCFGRPEGRGAASDSRGRKSKGMIDEYVIGRDEYIGAGSGSFGLLNGHIYANTFSLKQYIDKLQNGVLPVAFSRKFSEKELLRYAFLTRLFGTTLDIKEFNDKYSLNCLKLLWKEILFLKIAGAIKINNRQVSLTRKGMHYWLVAMREFFIGVNNFRQHCRNMSYN